MRSLASQLLHIATARVRQSNMKPCRAPDPFRRSVAAYQMLQYTAQLHHPIASECVTPLLPLITAALADPAPFAKRCAAAALSHLSVEATAAALYAHASILKSCIAKALVGCEGQAWEGMMHAGCSIAHRLDSVNGGGQYKLDVLRCAMEEVKRSDAAGMWGPWLRCLAGDGEGSSGSLLNGIGVDVLCCTSKLLPMLLDRLTLANAPEIRPICQVCVCKGAICLHMQRLTMMGALEDGTCSDSTAVPSVVAVDGGDAAAGGSNSEEKCPQENACP